MLGKKGLHFRNNSNSLSIYLLTGTDDEVQEYDYLGAWGPRFDKLADMYGPGEETEQEDE